jgi:uncharacterized protein (DUF1501 family)
MPNANFSTPKFLIVLCKDGGEDSIARFIPRSATFLNQIAACRPTLSYSAAEVSAFPAGQLLDADWAVHPKLALLQPIYAAGDMAVVHRVGPMFTDLAPLTAQQVRAATILNNTTGVFLPSNMGAHDTQQLGVASMITRDFTDSAGVPRRMGESGLMGRYAAAARTFNPEQIVSSPQNPARMKMALALGALGSARNVFNTVGLTTPLDVPSVGGRFNRQWAVSAQQNSALQRMDNINLVARSETRQEAYRQIAEAMRVSVGYVQNIIEGAAGTYTVDASFTPNSISSGWEGMLRTVARFIEARATGIGLPMHTTFFLNNGSYDTHFGQLKDGATQLPGFFLSEAQGIAWFRNAILALPGGATLWNNTIITDLSEFSRTLLENGSAGTDHAWARTCTLIGGAVRGGMYGTPPTAYGITTYNGFGVATGISSPAIVQGSHDVNGGELGGGSVYPNISLEQYWHEILQWFGANEADLTASMPRRGSFGAPLDLID